MSAAQILIRVRIPSGGTLKLRVPPSLTYGELLAQAAEAASVSTDGCHLSLNKKGPVPHAAPGVTLSQLGFCHGELLYLMDDATVRLEL